MGLQIAKFCQKTTKLRPLIWKYDKILVETTEFIFFINMALDLWIVFVIKYFMAAYDACLQPFYIFSGDLFFKFCPGHSFTYSSLPFD